MKHVCVLADYAPRPTGASSDEEVISLNTIPPNPNVRLVIDPFPRKILRLLPDRLDDLLRIAALIYAADTSVKRGSSRDVFGAEWQRSFRFHIPVSDLNFWDIQTTKDSLTETLSFLTGDEFSFKFSLRQSAPPIQGLLPYDELPHPLPRVDSVVLFSGGIDSLAAVLEEITEGRRPLLVSHKSTPPTDKRQRNLVLELQKHWQQWSFPHVSLWVNRARGSRHQEFTQRSRSFLFTSLGVASASLLNVHEIRLCDNGIISINLPRSGENLGTFLSRSTHPRYIELCNRLMRMITNDFSLSIKNTFLNKTKKEVLDVIKKSGHPELLQETGSCVHTQGQTKLHPHCGVCTQCIDRRFASIAADMEEFDLKERYKKDIFLAPLESGEERTHAENYVRFALALEKISTPDQLFANYTELLECFPEDGDAEQIGDNLWELFQRFQQQVRSVLTKIITNNANDILRGTIDKKSFLFIINSAQHLADPRINYIHTLNQLLCEALPLNFQTQKRKMNDMSRMQEKRLSRLPA